MKANKHFCFLKNLLLMRTLASPNNLGECKRDLFPKKKEALKAELQGEFTLVSQSRIPLSILKDTSKNMEMKVVSLKES